MITRLFLFVFWATTIWAKPTSVVMSSGKFISHGKATILDLRLEKTILSQLTMQEALIRLADGILSSTKGKVTFNWEIENSRDPSSKLPLHDPKVKLEASDTSLREVLDRLCEQAGWSYKKSPVGILFIDSATSRGSITLGSDCDGTLTGKETGSNLNIRHSFGKTRFAEQSGYKAGNFALGSRSCATSGRIAFDFR